MDAYKQEMTLEFSTLENLLCELAKDYPGNGALREVYSSLINTIKRFHKLCIDFKEGNEKPSLWLSELEVLSRKELSDYSKYKFGQILQDLISEDLIKFIHEEDNIIRLATQETDIKEICIDLAKKTYFKLLITEKLDNVPNELRLYKYNEFLKTNNYNTDCILLRDEKTFQFQKNDDLNNLQFLAPFLYPSKTLTINDKYLFEEPEDYEIIILLLKYAPELNTVIINTKYWEEKTDNVIANNLLELRRTFEDFKIMVKPYKRHQRMITNDIFKIIPDHSISNMEFREICGTKKLIARDNINFSITVYKKYSEFFSKAAV